MPSQTASLADVLDNSPVTKVLRSESAASSRRLTSGYEPTLIAPIHDYPISEESIDEYVEKLIKAGEQISSEYKVPPAT